MSTYTRFWLLLALITWHLHLTAQPISTFDGRVGIGTDSPLSALHLVQADNDLSILLKTKNSWTAYLTQNTASNFSISNGGQERLNILANGRIGIGVTSPEEKLHIGGDQNSSRLLFENGGDLMWKNTGGTNHQVLTMSSDNNVYLSATSNTSSDLIFRTGTGFEHRMRIIENGNVGIGTSAPETLLHIGGDQNSSRLLFENGGDLMWKNTSGANHQVLTMSSDNNVYLSATSNTSSDLIFRTGTGFEHRMRIIENGNIGIGTSLPEALLHIGGSGSNSRILLNNQGNISWKNSGGIISEVLSMKTDDNVYLDATSTATSDLIFRTGTSMNQAMRITDDGEVGIGMIPGATLHVNGDVKWSPVTSYVSIDAFGFQPRTDTDIYFIDESGLDPGGCGFCFNDFSAAIHLPQGATITSMKISFFDNNGTENFDVRLKRRSFATGSGSEVLSLISTSGASGSQRTSSTTTISNNVVDNENFSYYIFVSFPSDVSSQVFSAVNIGYTIDQPY